MTDKNLASAGAAHRKAAAVRSRKISSALADIGKLPKVKNPKRREKCRQSLFEFLVTYFPNSTGLSPLSDDHRRVIDRIEYCIRHGGQFVNCVYRGFAKTTISENSILWALLYGLTRFAAVFAANEDKASEIIESIKRELQENDLLYEDFPEAIHAIRHLGNKAQRCISQTYRDHLTHIVWQSDCVVFPAIPGSPSSGAIIKASGLTAANNGLKHKTPDGVNLRPALIVIDDPQTPESAQSKVQCRKLLNIIKKSLLGSAGHFAKPACVVNATVMQPGDLIEQLMDHAVNPAWQAERIPMVRKFADAHKEWLGQYAELRNTYDPDVVGSRERAVAAANAYYLENRERLDAGCQVSWQSCYAQGEHSAIQHAYNLLIDNGADYFASECQNRPQPDEPDTTTLSTAAIAGKLRNLPRLVVPLDAQHVTCSVDVQQDLLFYAITAWGDDFTGHILDYGCYPQQRLALFTLGTANPKISDFHTGGVEAQIYAALDKLLPGLLATEYKREDGATLKIERLLVDSGWNSDIICQYTRQSPLAAIIMPSKGVGIGATRKPIAEYQKKPGWRIGNHWYINMPSKATRLLSFDSNWYKDFVHARLATPIGDKGCLTIYGSQPHNMLAEHLTAEYPVAVTALGRTVNEWKPRVGKPDNHLLDCVVGCAVAASLCGCELMRTVPKVAPRAAGQHPPRQRVQYLGW